MFDSGISVESLIEELNTEVDIALDIPDATYVLWLNELQQTLYTEVIKEQKKVDITPVPQSPVDITSKVEKNARFEDIYAVYADDRQLIKSTVTSGTIFPDTYYKTENKMGYNTASTPSKLTIVYFVKPELIEKDYSVTVAMPIEFVDLVKAKLRGEAYKLANEDELAAKWLNDYNILLENLKMWIADKSPTFGM